uniref:Uncharacterized protein n=1 Tax=Megaselia scalaris TaxID=36166 RepID=T1GVV2_MEGSC
MIYGHVLDEFLGKEERELGFRSSDYKQLDLKSSSGRFLAMRDFYTYVMGTDFSLTSSGVNMYIGLHLCTLHRNDINCRSPRCLFPTSKEQEFLTCDCINSVKPRKNTNTSFSFITISRSSTQTVKLSTFHRSEKEWRDNILRPPLNEALLFVVGIIF